MRRLFAFVLLAAQLAIVPAAHARIRLATLPDRERVAVRFEDTGEVLVEELRTLTLDKGLNQVDFTWLGVNIDRSSVQMVPVAAKGPTILRTTYPPAEPTSLVWEVASPVAGPVQVRIAYLLQGLTRTVSWRAVIEETAKGQPTKLSLKLHQRLANESGEDFDVANLRASYGDPRDAGLQSGEERQQLIGKFTGVPFTRRYTYDPDVRGPEVAADTVLVNKAEAGLGKGLLPGGKMRIFQQTGETEAFIGEDLATPTALGEELILHTGTARDLVVRRAVLDGRNDILQKDKWGNTTLQNVTTQMRWEVENFTGETRTVRLVQHMSGEWDVVNAQQLLEKRIAPEKFEAAQGESNPAGRVERDDANTLVIHVPVPPNRRVVFTADLRQLHVH